MLKCKGTAYDYSVGSAKPAILLEEVLPERYNRWVVDTCYGLMMKEVVFVKKG